MKILDLFSGAGGLSLGFEMAGFEVSCAVDAWADALKTLAKNSPKTRVELIDLADLEAVSNLCDSLSEIDVVVGGPPCQGFSIAGKRDPEDPRNRLYKGFVEAIRLLSPKAFVMENVPTISAPSNKLLFDEIVSDFQALGYQVSSKVLLASEYGVPQNRRRMFIVGVRDGMKFDFPTSISGLVTAEEAIGDLPENSLTDGVEHVAGALSEFQRWARRSTNLVYNHQITTHSQKTIEVIGLVPDGGNFKSLPQEFLGIRNVNIAWTRLDSKKPSFTIDTGHRHHFHYKFNRVPTARESARLQSFPDDYIFFGSKTSQLRQIGNAVPPLLALSLANSLKVAIEGERVVSD